MSMYIHEGEQSTNSGWDAIINNENEDKDAVESDIEEDEEELEDDIDLSDAEDDDSKYIKAKPVSSNPSFKVVPFNNNECDVLNEESYI